MSDFNSLIPDARAFLGALAQNNNRAWWLDHKAEYDAKLKAPAIALLDEMTPVIAEMSELDVIPKLFRPHRDVRFSKDKTAYKTHMHMMWTLKTGSRQDVVFFFGIGLDYVSVGAGTMGFDKPVLADWRQFADLDATRMLGIMKDVTDKGYSLREPALKRVPPVYPADHPAGVLLRMKGCVMSGELGTDGPLIPRLTQAYRDLWPVNKLLIQLIES